MKKFNYRWLAGLLIFLVLLVNCRGEISDKPPINVNPNMDLQTKEKPQRVARPIPEGTVAFGYRENVNTGVSEPKFLKEDESFYTGMTDGVDKSGEINTTKLLKKIPESIKVDKNLLVRGQSRFNIYCAACHDQAGTSQSIVVKKGVGIPPPPDLASDSVVVQTDGNIFNTIKHGIRNMPAYGSQLEETDIWAVVSYVRAIQASRSAKAEDLPAKVRAELGVKN